MKFLLQCKKHVFCVKSKIWCMSDETMSFLFHCNERIKKNIIYRSYNKIHSKFMRINFSCWLYAQNVNFSTLFALVNNKKLSLELWVFTSCSLRVHHFNIELWSKGYLYFMLNSSTCHISKIKIKILFELIRLIPEVDFEI